MALIDKLTAIADAIRGKTGKEDSLTLEQMVTEIEGIEAGGGGGEVVSLIVKRELDFYSNGSHTLMTQQEFMDAGLVPNLETPLYTAWKHFRIEVYLDEAEWETATSPVIRSCIVDNYGGRYASDIGLSTVVYRKSGNDYNTTETCSTISVGSGSNGKMTMSATNDLMCYVGTYYKFRGNYTIAITCW